MNHFANLEIALQKGNLNAAIRSAEHVLKQNEYDNFWRICISTVVQHIHILFPNVFLACYQAYTQHKKSYSHALKMTKVICSAYKQHISLYVPENFNKICQCTEKYPIIELRKVLAKIEKSKKKITKCTKEKLYSVIGDILSVQCDDVRKYDEYGIVMYSHSRSSVRQLHNDMFHIFLVSAKNRLCGKSRLAVAQLIKLFMYDKILHPIGKQVYIVLFIALLLVGSFTFDSVAKVNKRKTEKELEKYQEERMFDFEGLYYSDNFPMCADVVVDPQYKVVCVQEKGKNRGEKTTRKNRCNYTIHKI